MSNPYKRLLNLLPGRPTLTGEVVYFADGVATIELPGGGRDQARGEATVGQHVYFRDGAIEGPAPDLPEDQVEI